MLTSKLRSKLKAIMSKEPAICHIGKDGTTQNVLQSINNALIARECVKISVLNNCDDDLRNIANKIEIALSCETVDILGRKILLYKFNKDNKNHII